MKKIICLLAAVTGTMAQAQFYGTSFCENIKVQTDEYLKENPPRMVSMSKDQNGNFVLNKVDLINYLTMPICVLSYFARGPQCFSERIVWFSTELSRVIKDEEYDGIDCPDYG